MTEAFALAFGAFLDRADSERYSNCCHTLNLPGLIWLYLHTPVILLSKYRPLRFIDYAGMYGFALIQAIIDAVLWYLLLLTASGVSRLFQRKTARSGEPSD